ncbi:MAG: membrane protein insertion efficiency factor YidD [Anderseniella sp.]
MADEPRQGVIARVMMGLIRAYQLTLSYFFGRTCRHLPTCSSYTMEAISRHGAWAGFWLGFFRISRCNPWGTSGYDPVPDCLEREGIKVWRYMSYGVDKKE